MINRIKHFYVNKYLIKPFSRHRYFISYDFKHKALWFRNYKVASRTIDHHLKKGSKPREYIYSSAVGYWAFRYRNYFKFAFVRNPVERFVSAWKDKVVDQNYFKFSDQELVQMRELDNFILWVGKHDLTNCDEHLRMQSALIDVNNMDFIGRFENFNEDFAFVVERLGLEHDENTVHLNSSKSTVLNISAKQKEAIAKLYAKDFQTFY